jgi:hypothetical protein
MIGVDLRPVIEAVNRLADALNRHAAAQEDANRLERERD